MKENEKNMEKEKSAKQCENSYQSKIICGVSQS